jgi:transposase-like protein
MSGLTITDIAKVFTDEAEAYKLLEAHRWPDGPVCPHCGSTKAYYLEPKKDAGSRTRDRKVADEQTKKSTSYRRVWKCGTCRKQYSVLVGTIFEGSHIPLAKWLFAVNEMCSNKNGVAAWELHRKLGISQKAAWFMLHRIRYAMGLPEDAPKLEGIVEADETYFGGAAKNMHKADRERRITGRGGVDKVPVVTLVARGGEARSQVVRPVTGENIGKVLHEHVARSAKLMTDTSTVYTTVGKAFASHETVDHGKGEYVQYNNDGGPHAYSNTAEGYFSQLKRSVDGTHHHVSEYHLSRYLAEFDFRYTTRKMTDAQRAALAIQRTAGKRLTYR